MASSREVRAGKAFVELGVKDKFTGQLDKISKKFTAIGAGLTKAGAGMAAVSVGILAPLGAASKLFADAGSEIFDVSKRTGVAAERLSTLKYAAEQSGATLEDLEKSIRFMQKNGMGFGRFDELANEINAIEDPAKRTARAMEVWGKSGAALIPMLDELAGAERRARSLGLFISDEDANRADEFGDVLGDVQMQLKAITFQAGAAVAKALLPFGDAVTGFLRATIDWARNNGELIATTLAFGAGLAAVGASVVTLGFTFAGVGLAITGVGATLVAVLNPISLVAIGLAGLTTWFLTSTETGGEALRWLGDKFNELAKIAKLAFGGIGDALAASDIELAGKILWAGLKIVFQAGVNELKVLWAGLLTGMVNGAVSVADAIQQAFFAMINAVASAVDSLQKKAAGVANVALTAASVIARSRGFGGTADALTAANSGIQIGSNVASAGLTMAGTGSLVAAAQISDVLDTINSFADSLAGVSIAEGQAQLDALRAQLTQLRKQAGDERAAIDSSGPMRFSGPDLEASVVAAAKKIESRGTFSASSAALRGLEGSPVQDRIAKASERTARNTDKIVANGLGLA